VYANPPPAEAPTYGLLSEFIQDLKNEGLKDRDLDPLFRSAEGYIELWERAVATIPVP
jgi:hypothetical protein